MTLKDADPDLLLHRLQPLVRPEEVHCSASRPVHWVPQHLASEEGHRVSQLGEPAGMYLPIILSLPLCMLRDEMCLMQCDGRLTGAYG